MGQIIICKCGADCSSHNLTLMVDVIALLGGLGCEEGLGAWTFDFVIFSFCEFSLQVGVK